MNFLVEDGEIEHCIIREHSVIQDIPVRIADSLIGRNVELRRSPYKPKAYKLTLGDHSKVGILFEFRWDERTYPPGYAFIEVQILEGSYLAPLTTWDFPKGACTFSDVAGNFDLPPPPPPQPTREADANNCEFYVNTLGEERRHYTGGGYDELRMVSYLSVNAKDLVQTQHGKITQVGMRLNGKDDVTSSQELEPAYYVLRKSLWLRGYETSDYDLRQLAYFIDVQR